MLTIPIPSLKSDFYGKLNVPSSYPIHCIQPFASLSQNLAGVHERNLENILMLTTVYDG